MVSDELRRMWLHPTYRLGLERLDFVLIQPGSGQVDDVVEVVERHPGYR